MKDFLLCAEGKIQRGGQELLDQWRRQNDTWLWVDLQDEDVNYSTTYKLLSNRDYVKIKNVLLQHTPALQKFIDQVSSDESDPVMASQVNNVLIAPLKKDASWLLKSFVVLFWLVSFAIPVVLFYTIDIYWYFPQ